MCAQLVGVLVCAEMNVHRDIMFHMLLIISVTIYYRFEKISWILNVGPH